MDKTLVDPNRLCMGCMELLENTSVPCPKCGFSLKDYQQPENGMPPYEILNGKYLVGKVIGIGGFGITYIGWDFYQSKKVCIKEYFPKGVAKREQTTTYSTEYSTYSMDVFTVNTKKAAYLGGLKGYIKEAETLSKFYGMPGFCKGFLLRKQDGIYSYGIYRRDKFQAVCKKLRWSFTELYIV